jgi:sulfane dehydrogenase subunit SoxC
VKDETPISRRALLLGAAGAVGAAGAAALQAQNPLAPAPVAIPADPSSVPGMPSQELGARSPFEHPTLAPAGVTTGASFAPLQDLRGTITPADLHFQRHHNGIALIDPQKYRLIVHGMVEQPVVFTLDDLKRFPSVSRIVCVECSGNGRSAYRAPKREMTPQDVDGLTSNSEWTGVPLSMLLREAGVKSGASWFLAEGGDAPKLARSIPLDETTGDALVAYAQNGEALRAPNGYPVRLLLPGYEGNANVKWLRRIKLGTEPWMTRDETSKYTDPLPDGTARTFSFIMDAKSIITSPAHPQQLDRHGWWPITGIAWSGRGRIAKVDISTDGGHTWQQAELQEPVLSKAHTRFHLMWQWRGEPARIMSRAMDETGGVQPTRAEFARVRGTGTDYHFNHIRAWDVERDGRVFFGVDA